MHNAPNLPPLPQSARLARLIPHLWNETDVVAIWLGGSLAAGAADEYSDVDLRVAVTPHALETWKTPDFHRLFEGEYVGGNCFPFADDAFLHHLALQSGMIFDLWVQISARDPSAEDILVLGCRDPEYQRLLDSIRPHPVAAWEPADPMTLQQALVDFWINSLKHGKVLHRHLDLLTSTGVGLERSFLLRLWHIQATGSDIGKERATIHTLTRTARAVETLLDAHAWRLQGAPLTTRAEIMAAIEAIRDEVSLVGRTLAMEMGFDYPNALEQTVRQAWRDVLATEKIA